MTADHGTSGRPPRPALRRPPRPLPLPPPRTSAAGRSTSVERRAPGGLECDDSSTSWLAAIRGTPEDWPRTASGVPVPPPSSVSSANAPESVPQTAGTSAPSWPGSSTWLGSGSDVTDPPGPADDRQDWGPADPSPSAGPRPALEPVTRTSDRWMTPGVVVVLVLAGTVVCLGVLAAVTYLTARGFDPQPIVQLAGTLVAAVSSLGTFVVQL